MAGWVGRPAGQIAAAVRSGEVTAAGRACRWRAGGESVLLALAAQIERARGWRRHAPAYDPAG